MARKRAISDDEKQARQESIQAAARDLLMDQPYHTINMSQVASAAGVAKGTVYLYFPTREALFLSVYEDMLDGWFDEVNAALEQLPTPSEDEQIARLLVSSLADRHELTRLVALGPLVFEFNIDYDRTKQHKLWLQERILRLGRLLEARLPHLEPFQGAQTTLRVYVQILGLEGAARPAPIAREVIANEVPLFNLDYEQELNALVLAVLRSYR